MDKVSKDPLIERIGTHGKFQLRTFLILQIVGVFAGWQLLAGSFFLPETDFWCSPAELKLPRGQRPETDISPRSGEDNTTDHCSVYNLVFSSTNITEISEDENTTECTRWDFDRTKTPESVVSQFSLVCSNDVQRSLGSSLYMAAKIIGSLVFGVLSDKFGRKKVLLGASLLLTLSGVSTAFAPNMYTWIVLRAFVALSATGLFITGFTYCMEMVGGVWSTLVSFGLEYSWALGYLTVPLIAWAAPAWSGLQLAVSVPTLVFTILVAIPGLVPESPRWLLAAGKKEADEVINKISKINGIEINSYNMDTQADKKLEAEAQSGSLLDLFKSWPLIRCTLIMYYLWFTNNLVYYGFTLNAGKLFPGDLHINMLVSAALEFLAYTISIFAFLFLGRRWSVCSFMSLGGLSLLLTLAMDSQAAKAALAQTGKFLITASFAMVYQYAAEMFPTVVRNAGIGSCSAFSRIGSILAPFVGREMAEVSPIAPMLIFGFTALLAGVLTLFLPETKNVTLPDTIKEGEEFCRSSGFSCNRSEKK